MTEALKQARSKWWRFSRYEIRDDRIRPAPGARLEEYDPWADYEESNIQNAQPPYQSLLELRDRIRIQRGAKAKALLSTAHQGMVLDWTARHGLLGILPQQALFIHRAPRPEDDGLPSSVQAISSRQGGRWLNVDLHTDRPFEEEIIHAPFSLELFHGIERTATARAAHDFSVDGKQIHPIFSAEFWWNYCEPVWEWFMAVHETCLAIRNRDAYSLNIALSAVGHSVKFKDSGADLVLNYPSLLSAFTSMFVQDSVSGYRRVKCAGCGMDVITSAYQTRYCSRTCGDRDRKRRSRAAAKLAAVMTQSRGRRYRAP